MNVVYQLTATTLLSVFYMWSDFAAKMPESLLPVLCINWPVKCSSMFLFFKSSFENVSKCLLKTSPTKSNFRMRLSKEKC